MDKTKLIELLNEALQNEYTDVFLYPRQADMLREKDKKVSEMFERFGRMELRHADNLATQILTLGGKPDWDFKLIDAGSSIDKMLQRHLERESKCIQIYDKLIELTDREEQDQLKLILKGIRSEEETHAAAIKELIKRK